MKKYLNINLILSLFLVAIAIIGRGRACISGFSGFVAGLFTCAYLFQVTKIKNDN